MDLFRKRSRKRGLPPGTLTAPDDSTTAIPTITLFQYNEEAVEEKQIDAVQLRDFAHIDPICWINVNGLGDVDIFRSMGTIFSIHDLLLEDILNTDQRPKFEERDSSLFLVMKMISLNKETRDIDVEQVSFVLTPNAALTFQERPGDVFDLIRTRIRNARGRIRKMGSDYLIYSLMDAIVDTYFSVLEQLGEEIEEVEEEVISNPTTATSVRIHHLRRKIIILRRSIWPLREVAGGLLRSESPLIGKETRLYLKDLYDHTIQVIETLETFRDMTSGMLDIYLSSTGNRMNEIMKVLTIISTVFIPLGFLAGLYGMNFRHMPELDWRWSYPLLLILMATVAGGLLVYFRKKRWL